MRAEAINEIQERLFERIRQIGETKGREYATDEDRLADFKAVAAEAGVTPLQAWAAYVKKHERAIDTFIREGSTKSEGIQDRVLDVIVYHILLLGLVQDAEVASDGAYPAGGLDDAGFEAAYQAHRQATRGCQEGDAAIVQATIAAYLRHVPTA